MFPTTLACDPKDIENYEDSGSWPWKLGFWYEYEHADAEMDREILLKKLDSFIKQTCNIDQSIVSSLRPV